MSANATVTVDCTLAALTAKKTAEATYDRDIEWSLTKTVDDDSHSGTAGQAAGTSKWSVEATKSVVDDNFKVTGEITITNDAAIEQTFSVTDKLDDGTIASVDCPNLTVPAGESIICTYTASPTKDATLNTATVSAPGNQDVEATAPVSYTAKVIGDEKVTLADERFDNFSEEISDTTTKTFPETFTCSSDPADYNDGKYDFTETNTATLTGPNTPTLSKDASVKVECTLAALTAKKTAIGSFDRTISWDLKKSVTPTSHSGLAGASFNSTWSVEATKSVVEDNYKVTGKITITNDAAIEQTFSVSDELDDGTAASVDCDSATAGNQNSGKVPANGSITCDYTASTKNATKNTATVKAAGNADVVATAPVSYTPIVKGDNSVTLADPRFSYTQLISGNLTKTFPETFKCPTDRAAYNSNYMLTKTFTNTATLKGATTDLSKSATVTLNCRYPWQSETATGHGTVYPGTTNWFMYTAYTTNKVDLIAGQNYDAGDIYMTRSGSYTYVKVTLQSGFRWANMRENLKIQDFANAPTKYALPGNFKYKFTVTPQSTVTYTAKIPGTTAKFYGIHADVERFVN
jgi:glycine cleavage system H lipoate-binding protein